MVNDAYNFQMTNETDLKGHSKNKKRLHPPLAKLDFQLTSWRDTAMPEILWAVLVRGNLDRNTALDFFRYVANFVKENPIYADVRLTKIAELQADQRTRLISHMVNWSTEVRDLLRSLLVFPDLPGRTEWLAVIGDTDWKTAGPNLATAVKEVLWHQSEPATDCRWIEYLCFMHSGKMKFSSAIPGIRDTVRGVYEYPNFGDVHLSKRLKRRLRLETYYIRKYSQMSHVMYHLKRYNLIPQVLPMSRTQETALGWSYFAAPIDPAFSSWLGQRWGAGPGKRDIDYEA